MSALSRRDFTRLFAASASAALVVPGEELAAQGTQAGSLPTIAPAGQNPGEDYWRSVRQRFVLPPDLGYLNAANLCPASLPTIEALERDERALDADPSGPDRTRLGQARETTRTAIAAMLGVWAEEIILTRNTSEANNLVSSGLHLGPGDEVVVFGDNHPSSNAAWKTKAERFGYQVVTVPVISPHPGAEAYIDAFAKAITPRTRVLAFTHVTNSVGDLLPAAELCAMARAKGVLTLVDGAQTFGVLNVNLGEMQPDFYSGSLHKWPCGPKETGVLFLARATHDRVWPSIVSLYPGTVGVSRKLEGMGQRDDAALAALGAAVAFQTTIGRAAIETRVRALAQALITGLTEIRGVTVWTHNDPRRSLAVVTAKPADLDVRKVAATLRAEDRIVVATRGGQDRPGLRFSPHFYNTMDEIERAVGAVKRLVAQGA